jgi:hypothetical protein
LKYICNKCCVFQNSYNQHKIYNEKVFKKWQKEIV